MTMPLTIFIAIASLLAGAGLVASISYWVWVRKRDEEIFRLQHKLLKLRKKFVEQAEHYRMQAEQIGTDNPEPVMLFDDGPDNQPTTTNYTPDSNAPVHQDVKPEVPQEPELVLHCMRSLLDLWNDRDLTKKQKASLEQRYIGQLVAWEVQIESIAASSNGRFNVTVLPPRATSSIDCARAEFDGRQRASLQSLEKGQCVVIAGVIDRFFIAPELTQCELLYSSNQQAGLAHLAQPDDRQAVGS